MAKHRVEFRLSMPGRSSWNGGWSGEGKNYVIVKRLGSHDVARLFGEGDRDRSSWSHRWSDGWCAVVEARIVQPNEKLKKSDGFNGYDWMVDNIVAHGKTCAPGQVPA